MFTAVQRMWVAIGVVALLVAVHGSSDHRPNWHLMAIPKFKTELTKLELPELEELKAELVKNNKRGMMALERYKYKFPQKITLVDEEIARQQKAQAQAINRSFEMYARELRAS